MFERNYPAMAGSMKERCEPDYEERLASIRKELKIVLESLNGLQQVTLLNLPIGQESERSVLTVIGAVIVKKWELDTRMDETLNAINKAAKAKE
jgi:hypothetical protein